MLDARVIDANVNRAAEGLRTLEDLARFTLARRDLAERLRAVRHAARAAPGRLGFDSMRLAAARDAGGDVGAPAEDGRPGLPGGQPRAGVHDVASAAAGRVTEALRVLEEHARLASAEVASELERLRYAVYDLVRALTLALGTGGGAGGCGAGAGGRGWRLCVLISASACVHRPWEEVARAACAGGADMLQLREKTLSDRELMSRARRLVEMCREHGVSAVVNDRADVALLAHADGVHLGGDDLPIEEVRRFAGAGLLVGATAASLGAARAAVRTGADYLGLGPMYASATKPKPGQAGPELLRACLGDDETGRLPALAISGIDAARARELAAIASQARAAREGGGFGVAVCEAVCGARDPGAAAAAIRAALEGALAGAVEQPTTLPA